MEVQLEVLKVPFSAVALRLCFALGVLVVLVVLVGPMEPTEPTEPVELEVQL